MKLRLTPLFVAAFGLLGFPLAHGAELAGKWTSEFDSQIGIQKYVFEFTNTAGRLTGKATAQRSMVPGEFVLNSIVVDGDTVSFAEPLTIEDVSVMVVYSGKINGNQMDLTRQVGDFATEQIVAKRVGASVVATTDRPAIGAGPGNRLAASFLFALGRLPTAAEATSFSNSSSFTDLLANHRHQLSSDKAAQQGVAAKAFQDAFGKPPASTDLAAVTAPATYTELMQQHVKKLAASPEEYAQVLNRVYQFVIRRDVYPEEIEYWKKQSALPYAVLVGCVDNWGRRNQPGLMVTAGTAAVSVNCVYLNTVRLSPAEAAEARAALNLPAVADHEAGTNLLAAGSEKVVTDGKMHLAVALKD